MYFTKEKFLLFIFIFVISLSAWCFATEPESEEFVFDNTVREHPMNAIQVPEKDINLTINDLSRDAKVYLYLPTDMLRYNLEKFLSNNLNNDFLIESWEAEDLQELLNKEDFIGYIKYFKQYGFAKESNEIELRHYSFCLDSVELLDDYVEYNGSKYINMRIYPNEDNEFKIVTKDYFVNYDSRNIVIMIDEYGAKTYIDLTNYNFTQNSEHPNISELNVVYDFQSSVDPEEMDRITDIAYFIIYLILFIIFLVILGLLYKHHKKVKKELEDRMYWKKKKEDEIELPPEIDTSKLSEKEINKLKKKEQKKLLKEIKSRKRKKNKNER